MNTKYYIIILVLCSSTATASAQEHSNRIDLSAWTPSVHKCWMEEKVDDLYFTVVDNNYYETFFYVKDPEKSEVIRIIQSDFSQELKDSILNNYVVSLLNIINEYSESVDDEWTFYSEDRIKNIEDTYINKINQRRQPTNNDFKAVKDSGFSEQYKTNSTEVKTKELNNEINKETDDGNSLQETIIVIIIVWVVFKSLFKAFFGKSKSDDKNNDWLDAAWFHDHHQKM